MINESWQDYLAIEVPEIERLTMQKHEGAGCPSGGETLEDILSLELKLKKAG